MAIDREATLKNAEKFLRVGRLDAAIAEYARVVEDQPRDWGTANALGDLYLRAGQQDKAVPLYRRIAEHLLAEGFYPKAAATFKKILKIAPEDEEALLRVAEISARQGLMADAKAHYATIERRRRQRGDEAGADAIVVRLGTLDADDLDARLAAAKAAERGGDLAAAATQYRELYDAFNEQGRDSEALAVLRDSARCNPSISDPALFVPLAALAFREERADEARELLARASASGSAGRDAILELAWKLAGQDLNAAGFCVDVAVDAFVSAGDFDAAATVLQELATRAPGQTQTLLRLVEVCVDGGLDAIMYEAQALLADAYMHSGQASEARVIAEDLVGRDPGNAAHVDRLRRALRLLGVEDVEAVIAERLSSAGQDPLETFPPIDEPAAVDAVQGPAPPTSASKPVENPNATHVVPKVASPPAAVAETAAAPGPVEIDLTVLLGEIEGQAPAPESAPRPTQDLEEIFAGLRAEAGRDDEKDESAEHMELARTYFEMGMPEDALGSLEIAARSPRYRFAAASMLAQIHRDSSDLNRAIEWLERAAEVPAPGVEEGRALLYDLGDVLETVGETARALAVFLELDADAPGYRDVTERVMRLSKIETEG